MSERLVESVNLPGLGEASATSQGDSCLVSFAQVRVGARHELIGGWFGGVRCG